MNKMTEITLYKCDACKFHTENKNQLNEYRKHFTSTDIRIFHLCTKCEDKIISKLNIKL